MKIISFFKYFSLASLAASILVHQVSLESIWFNTNYFLVLHATTMISFIGMIFVVNQRNKDEKNSLTWTLKNFNQRLRELRLLAQQEIMTFVFLGICITAYYAFFQYHFEHFMLHAENESELSNNEFIALASGHWIIFSALSSIYFIIIIPLRNKWARIANG